MKLKLIAQGYENFTGAMGIVNFTNGVSDEDVPHLHARRIANIVTAVWLENGANPSVSSSLLANQNTAASTDLNAPGFDPIAPFVSHVDEGDRGENGEETPEDMPTKEQIQNGDNEGLSDEDVQKKSVEGLFWTEKELGEIADKSGIKGLRDIADPVDIKGNSIASLIEQILSKNIQK